MYLLANIACVTFVSTKECNYPWLLPKTGQIRNCTAATTQWSDRVRCSNEEKDEGIEKTEHG